MDLKKIGKLISESRKQAGYTQKQIADFLYVSDKAVSKWERGLSVPDQILLPKLSMILDVDIEHLIPNQLFETPKNWEGILILDDSIDSSAKVFNKPMIYYLLSYFMLVNIRRITIIGCNKKYINSLKLNKYGLVINYEIERNSNNKMIVYGRTLLFGANITRLFKSFMDQDNNIKIFVDGNEVPILFSHNDIIDINEIRKTAETKIMGRGLVNIPMNTDKQIKDASKFVEIYEKNSKYKISDICEIYKNRKNY